MYDISKIEKINTERFDNFYFIYGREKYLIDIYTKKILNKILPKGSRNSFNYKKFTLLDFDMRSFKNSVETLPFTSKVKCILISDLDIESMKAEEMKELIEVLSDLPDFVSVIVSQISLNVDIRKSSKYKKFISSIKNKATIIELNEMDSGSLAKHVMDFAKERNTEISKSNAYKVVKILGSNILNINNEMEKLCAFSSYGEITEEMIDKLLIKNLEATVFELSNDIIYGKYESVFNKLNILFNKKEDPIIILSTIISAYVDIYRVKCAINSKSNTSDIIKMFNYKNKEFRINNARSHSNKISLKSLCNILEILLETDILLKSSKVESKIIIETMISKIICELRKC